MHIDRRRFIGAALVACAAACTTRTVPPQSAASLPPPAPAPTAEPAVAAVEAAVPAYQPPLLAEAMAALERHGIAARDKLALVDFSLPSSEPRLHLVDVGSGKVERSWLVAHGKGSDPSGTGMLQRFSNEPGSNASCNGAFLTADRYVGEHGNSQRLIGLDPTNDKALDRAIVIHGAEYVNPALISSQGRIGRSQGCFAVAPHEVEALMNALGPGRMIYAAKAA
jgi:hypothetical protein